MKIEGPVYSTPAAWKGTVALGTIDGRIIGIDALTGKALWEVVTGRPVLAEGAVENGYLYIGGGDRVFYKIDMRNGKTVWKYPGVLGLMQGKASVSGSSVVFGAWDRHLYCVDKNTGALRWKWNNGKPQPLYSPGNIFPVCSDGKVFIVAPDRFMTALDQNTGKEIWRINRHHVRESMGASPDGSVVYAKLMNDTVIGISAKENYALTIKKINAGFGYEHNPCPVTVTEEEVLTGTRDGVVVSLNPLSQEVNWKYKAGTSSVNKVIADSKSTFWFTLMEGKIIGIRTEQ
jgi:outer membrane protein assembly factor BamB